MPSGPPLSLSTNIHQFNKLNERFNCINILHGMHSDLQFSVTMIYSTSDINPMNILMEIISQILIILIKMLFYNFIVETQQHFGPTGK
jgi:hypothetical protein